MSVADLKAAGNAAFASKDYAKAIDSYTQAISAAASSPDDAAAQAQVHVLYSNRSACHAGLRNWDEALKDADECIKANPNFAKGYGRKGSALHGARRFDESVAAYEEGLKIAPSDVGLKKGLEDVQRAADSDGPGGGMGKLFSDPQLFQKLAANPKTATMLADQSFVAKLKELQANPNNAMAAFQDPRMITAMGVLMGIDLNAFERPEGSNDLPTDLEGKREEIEKQTGRSAPEPTSAASSSSSSKPAPAAASSSAPEAEMKDADEDEDDEEAKAKRASAEEEKKAKAAADAEKAKGNERYLKRDFPPAIEHYQRAWELHQDITYLNNLAAAYFEAGQLDECVKTCDKAVEEGRKMRADYKLVAKAFGRKGSALLKKEELEGAIDAFERSLTEHRTPDILNKLRATEKELKERTRRAYIDPAKADEERAKGNDLYKKGDFAGAVAAYTEAIKRNPEDARGFTNRASAYLKLMALSEGLKDADEAIKIDPKFIKAHIRRAQVLNSMKEHSKALTSISRAADLDREEGNKNAREIRETESKIHSALYQSRSNMSDEETLQQAMRDPEVAQIMSDPVMQSILQQAQSDPRALMNHMQNADIRAKIEKLMAAGIIKTR